MGAEPATPQWCLRCLSDATVHVVAATPDHGILYEEFYCDKCYAVEEAAEQRGERE